MATRHIRSGRGRRTLIALTVLAGVAAGVWFAPAAVVRTDLRDLPLARIFAGIDGRITSRDAAWRWWGGIEYRDVRLCDGAGRTLVAVPQIVVDRGLLALALNPTDLGAVRLVGAEALVEVRRGGSGIEDMLAPWLAGGRVDDGLPDRGRPASFELELVDAAVELVDLERGAAWRITDILAAGTIRPDATLAGWTISGRVRPAAAPVRDPAASANRIATDRILPAGQATAPPPAVRAGRLDRTTVAAGATAILARDGGWSVSSPDRPEGPQARSLAIAATRVPLGITRVAATRFAAVHALDGVADVRLDLGLPPAAAITAIDAAVVRSQPGPAAEIAVTGVVSATTLSVCTADTGVPLVTLDRGEMPLDLSIAGDRVTVRSLKLVAPLVKGEVSGRLRLPANGAWEWAESLVGDDFAVAVDVDLAAAARAMPGGLAIRPDVRVTDGLLKLSAVSRADGLGRVLEVRAGASELAAVQSVLPAGERPLRWSEPFTAWLRGRRGPGRGDLLRIEEARIASPAVEVAAAGNAESSTVQWSVDLDRLVAEAARCSTSRASNWQVRCGAGSTSSGSPRRVCRGGGSPQVFPGSRSCGPAARPGRTKTCRSRRRAPAASRARPCSSIRVASSWPRVRIGSRRRSRVARLCMWRRSGREHPRDRWYGRPPAVRRSPPICSSRAISAAGSAGSRVCCRRWRREGSRSVAS